MVTEVNHARGNDPAALSTGPIVPEQRGSRSPRIAERKENITDLELSGKTALVTGSTAGIGLAIAEALAREGAEVIVNGRTPERVDQAIRAITASVPSARLRGIAADLSTREGMHRVIAELPSVEILVNNLGIFEAKAFAEIRDEDWLRFFETNVLSGVRLARQYLPKMAPAYSGSGPLSPVLEGEG